MPYTNEESFVDSWSDKELETLISGRDNLGNASKFQKAADSATAVINDYLTKGAYLLPLPYTAYNAVKAPAPLDYEYLWPTLQECSDCLTAYYMAKSADRMKKTYETCYTTWMFYLKDVGAGKIILPYDKAVTTSNFVVKSRPQVFTRDHLDDNYPKNKIY